MSLGSLIFFSQCSDEEDGGGDNWAGAVADTYTGAGTRCNNNTPLTASTTIITRISDKVFHLQLITEDGSSTDSYCLDSISMNSSSTFSINEIEGCLLSENATGGGNFSGNNLNYTLHPEFECKVVINGSK